MEVLLLKIHKALKEGKNHYEATRQAWKVGERAFNVKYVCGVVDNKIVCVFKPVTWFTIETGICAGRKCFQGIEAPSDIMNSLLEKDVKEYFGYGEKCYVELNTLFNK